MRGMRLRLGRPSIDAYAERFDVPPARTDSELTITFLGVSTLLIRTEESALLTDGYFSRPSLARVALGRIAPDETRIAACLERAGVHWLDAVVPLHTHFDHALDSAAVAARTGAVLVGGQSAATLGHELPPEQLRVATSGESMRLGHFTVTLVESEHCPPDRFPGTIEEPVRPPARASAYRCGEAWSMLLAHDGGHRVLVQGSAGYRPGALAGQQAEIAYLGVGQLGRHDAEYLTTYWAETERTVGARLVVLINWDDFFRPLDRPLRALPYAGDDLDHTVRVLGGLAADDGVALHFPTVWRREDPWTGIEPDVNEP